MEILKDNNTYTLYKPLLHWQPVNLGELSSTNVGSITQL